jgi:hypothetical protein
MPDITTELSQLMSKSRVARSAAPELIWNLDTHSWEEKQVYPKARTILDRMDAMEAEAKESGDYSVSSTGQRFPSGVLL